VGACCRSRSCSRCRGGGGGVVVLVDGEQGHVGLRGAVGGAGMDRAGS
jgi:hypothetical protein